mmetsp:Transcript_33177/g.59376  ORF Transcript_33177/g.59376 Transcript_33177/m.59376 type:complete len:490 (-) Transcript_33177:1699-3168(-)
MSGLDGRAQLLLLEFPFLFQGPGLGLKFLAGILRLTLTDFELVLQDLGLLCQDGLQGRRCLFRPKIGVRDPCLRKPHHSTPCDQRELCRLIGELQVHVGQGQRSGPDVGDVLGALLRLPSGSGVVLPLEGLLGLLHDPLLLLLRLPRFLFLLLTDGFLPKFLDQLLALRLLALGLFLPLLLCLLSLLLRLLLLSLQLLRLLLLLLGLRGVKGRQLVFRHLRPGLLQLELLLHLNFRLPDGNLLFLAAPLILCRLDLHPLLLQAPVPLQDGRNDQMHVVVHFWECLQQLRRGAVQHPRKPRVHHPMPRRILGKDKVVHGGLPADLVHDTPHHVPHEGHRGHRGGGGLLVQSVRGGLGPDGGAGRVHRGGVGPLHLGEVTVRPGQGVCILVRNVLLRNVVLGPNAGGLCITSSEGHLNGHGREGGHDGEGGRQPQDLRHLGIGEGRLGAVLRQLPDAGRGHGGVPDGGPVPLVVVVDLHAGLEVSDVVGPL